MKGEHPYRPALLLHISSESAMGRRGKRQNGGVPGLTSPFVGGSSLSVPGCIG